MLEIENVISADGRKYTVIKALGRGANTAAYLAQCDNGKFVSKCILKEYSPLDRNDDAGKIRFINSAKMQNEIRQKSVLNNQTPPVCHIFEANGTAYIDVACYNGNTLDKMNDLTLPQYMEICRTIAKTVGYYHRSGYLCLDLKPENIFIMQNSPDDTITQLAEFIDFDSVRDISENNACAPFPYTREWAAPEQMNPYSAEKISPAADIFTVGEIIFYHLFGRHSCASEHRGFSRYPFDECKKEYHKYIDRPDIQALFTRIFRNTLRSSAANRFNDIDDIVKLLDEVISEMNRRDYVIPKFPPVSPDFVGRVSELRQISENLARDTVLFVTGIGGIGKSTLVKNYIARYRTEYDVVVYLEFDGDIMRTFCDDLQLQLSTISRQKGESFKEYFERKLTHFKNICGSKKVLIVVDNFTGKLTKQFSRIIECGYDTIIISRKKPPNNSFAIMEISAICDADDLFRLIAVNLERPMTKEERRCFGEIISLVQGHTLVTELIARQIAAGRIEIHNALNLIRENGFSDFSSE